MQGKRGKSICLRPRILISTTSTITRRCIVLRISSHSLSCQWVLHFRKTLGRTPEEATLTAQVNASLVAEHARSAGDSEHTRKDLAAIWAALRVLESARRREAPPRALQSPCGIMEGSASGVE